MRPVPTAVAVRPVGAAGGVQPPPSVSAAVQISSLAALRRSVHDGKYVLAWPARPL
jgi:hypothetical protein